MITAQPNQPKKVKLTPAQLKKVKEIMLRAETDPVTFISKFLKTFDPRLKQPNIPFKLFHFQEDLVATLKEAIEQGHDLFIDKSRDMGASYTTLATLLWFWRYVPGSNFLLGSRKEDYVDNRALSGQMVSNAESSLFGKLDYMLKHIHPSLFPKGFDFNKHNGYMKLINPENGNIISGESSNSDFSRAGRYKAILLDEFAFWDNDAMAWGSTADASPCRIILTTPGTRPSKAKRLRFGKDGEQIKVVELDYHKDPRKNSDWEASERARRSDEDFAREIQRNWETSIKGRVYDEISNIVKGNFPYVPDWPLYVAWDFGLDGTSIQWWQKNLTNGKKRLVESYFNVDKPIQWYLPYFGLPVDSLYNYANKDIELLTKTKLFKKAIHFGDVDVAKRGYQTKDTISTRQILQDSGIYVNTKPESNTFHIRRNATKVLLQQSPEVNTTTNNDYWVEAMMNARYPERQENSQATSAINMPIHDWTSHHRTATEYFAVNYVETLIKVYKPPTTDVARRKYRIGAAY